MTERLKGSKKVVGIKQVKKAINSARASEVYIAKDAEEKITQEVLLLCRKREIPVIDVDTMKDLGNACGIDISAATAALLI